MPFYTLWPRRGHGSGADDALRPPPAAHPGPVEGFGPNL